MMQQKTMLSKPTFEENPAMKVYAENVPYAVPAMDNEIQ